MAFFRFVAGRVPLEVKTALALTTSLCLGQGTLQAQRHPMPIAMAHVATTHVAAARVSPRVVAARAAAARSTALRSVATHTGVAHVASVPVVWELPDAPGSLPNDSGAGVTARLDGKERTAGPGVPQLGTEIRAGSTITGTVLDVNGNPVAGAKVELLSQNRFSGALDARADDDGNFKMIVPAGTYRMIVTSTGLDALIVSDFTVAPGAVFTIPKMAMKITSTSADVTVRVTQAEIAEEQVHAAEKQRVYGILPNFYSSYIWDAAPMTSKQKFKLAGHSVLDPVSFATRFILTGVEHKRNTYVGYGQGFDGFGQRYGATFGDSGFARIIGSALLPSITHQDPRYFYKGTGTFKQRAIYAMSRSVVTRNDKGQSRPNISKIGGAFAAGAISTLYKPDGANGPSIILYTGLVETAGNAIDNLIREFLLRRVTPSVPEFEQGQPQADVSHNQPTKASAAPPEDSTVPPPAESAQGTSASGKH